MAWPLSQDYNEALQNPQTSFSDAELRRGQVVVNVLGIPQPCSGNFADVYAVECPGTRTKWAVKCFTREVHGLRERYSEISKYLQQAHLPFTVDFQYLEQGIRIGGHWYPILKMHWVEGFTLNAFVRDMLDKPAMLDGLSRIWLRMAQRLREGKLAHADLQHGNVLLVPGSNASSLAVKLIDYDGMWVPALANKPSGEVGHPSYQHPQRLREGGYNQEVDRFPLLAIYVALRALVVGGRQLWERYDNGDNLLFRQADFEAPGRSPLFAELMQINDPLTRSLVELLSQASEQPLEQTPHFQDLVRDEKPATSSATRVKVPAMPQTATAATTEPNVFQDIESADANTRSRRKKRRDQGTSVVPWLVGGVVAACVLIGGAAFWARYSKSLPHKPLSDPDQSQVRADRMDAKKKPESNQPELARARKEATSSAPKKQETPPSEIKQPPAQRDKNDSPLDDPPSLPDKPNPTPDKPNPPLPGEATKPMDSPSPPTKPKLEGSPAEKLQESVFLSELPYLSKKHANDFFATNGTLFGRKFTVYGKESPHGIFLHPGERDFSEISYKIGRKWAIFRSGVAVPRMRDNGAEKGIGSPLTFEVLDDEDKLWTSKPVQDFGKPQWCEVNVEKVDVLKLRVRCPGSAGYARAIWFEPQVATKSDRPAPSNIVTRLPAPDEAVLKTSTEDVRNIYRVDYDAARKPGERSALAAKLFERGIRPKEDPARRFACLSQARDLAAGCGDVVLSLRAIDELSEVFTVEVLPMKVAALGSLANTLRGKDALRSLLFGQILPVLDEAEAADDYEAAAKLLAIAEKASRSSTDRYLTTLISLRRTRTERLRKAYANIAAAVKTLAVDLRNAEANLTVGKFECFDKEDWYKGLSMLARGSDATLAELARTDRGDPTASASQADLGQKWWELADKQSEPNVKSALQRRARYWFRAALPLLEGDDKIRIASRLEKKVGNLRFIPGLVTELFAGENFEKRIKTRLDYKIDYNWGEAAPAEGVPADHFSIRWQGVLIPPRAGKYKIIISYDDDVRLLLDGKLAINYGADVRPNNKIAEVTLSAQPHRLLLEFREATGPAYVHLSWSLEGDFKEQAISSEYLYHEAEQERLLAP